MIKVLFVCLGNICRSPLAEAILQKKVSDAQLSAAFHIDSCGTSAYHVGSLPDPRTVAIAQKYNVPIAHKAKDFKNKYFAFFDHILVMDKSNHRSLVQRANTLAEVEKINYVLASEADIEVGDPYYGGVQGFDAMYHTLNRGIDAWYTQFQRQINTASD